MNTLMPVPLLAGWCAMAVSLLSGTALFTAASHGYGYDVAVRDMAVIPMALSLAGAGASFLLIVPLLRRTASLYPMAQVMLLVFIAAVGIAARLMLMASEPVLEDDYKRYLWDGAVTASGLNPYAMSPEAALSAPPQSEIGRLAAESGAVIGHINHPDLRTVYPPVAQAVYAFTYRLDPWSLTAWRMVCLLLELCAFGLLVMLLRDVGRSPLWAVLYWWNPVALKEAVNSAHMEPILLPLILGALVLANRGRLYWAGASLLLAAGTKLWPVLLMPLIWRPLLERPRKLLIPAMLCAIAAAVLAVPLLLMGLGENSGLAAYAQDWKTNSALTPLLELIAAQVFSLAGTASADPAIAARLITWAALSILCLWLARKPWDSPQALAGKAFILVAGVFLLSPAQFPWYYLWVLPLLAIHPVPGLLMLTATLPLYYLAFHFLARDQPEIFSSYIVWAIWLPVWALLGFEALRNRGFGPHGARLQGAVR